MASSLEGKEAKGDKWQLGVGDAWEVDTTEQEGAAETVTAAAGEETHYVVTVDHDDDHQTIVSEATLEPTSSLFRGPLYPSTSDVASVQPAARKPPFLTNQGMSTTPSAASPTESEEGKHHPENVLSLLFFPDKKSYPRKQDMEDDAVVVVAMTDADNNKNSNNKNENEAENVTESTVEKRLHSAPHSLFLRANKGFDKETASGIPHMLPSKWAQQALALNVSIHIAKHIIRSIEIQSTTTKPKKLKYPPKKLDLTAPKMYTLLDPCPNYLQPLDN